jgi:ribonuclease HI
MSTIHIYTDGGARGNPGPGAAAFIIKRSGKIIASSAKSLEYTTNNIAEYTALLMAVEWLAENKDKIKNDTLLFFLDSLLVVNQLNGVYKVKDEKLKKYYIKIKSTIDNMQNAVNIRHITREKNSEVDAIVNKIYDEN